MLSLSLVASSGPNAPFSGGWKAASLSDSMRHGAFDRPHVERFGHII